MDTLSVRRVIATEDLKAYAAAGWERCPVHALIDGGTTDDSNGCWRDRRMFVRKTHADAKVPEAWSLPSMFIFGRFIG